MLINTIRYDSFVHNAVEHHNQLTPTNLPQQLNLEMAAQLTSKHISTACTAAARGSKPVAPVKLPASVLAPAAPVVRASSKPTDAASTRRGQRLTR
eukprot:scaffold40205_cov20-Tisochrysis_lutea.AAC.1